MHPAARSCAHCGAQRVLFGSVNGTPVCHTSWKPGVPLAEQDDCYRLVTVYGELMGSRRNPVLE